MHKQIDTILLAFLSLSNKKVLLIILISRSLAFASTYSVSIYDTHLSN